MQSFTIKWVLTFFATIANNEETLGPGNILIFYCYCDFRIYIILDFGYFGSVMWYVSFFAALWFNNVIY